MAMVLALVFLPAFLIVYCTALTNTTSHKYETFLDAELSDKLFLTDKVFEVPSDCEIHCGILCSRHKYCLTFTFYQGRCQGHSAVMTSESNHTVAMGARSYVTGGSERCIGNGVQLLVDPSIDVKVAVLCEDDWLVIQRRLDGSVDFHQDWEAYKNGFGSPTGELWLGLETVHRLTRGVGWELQVTLGDWEGNVTHANYDNFSIADAANNYTFHANYLEDSSEVNDSLALHSGYQFTTHDVDNDISDNKNCADKLNGGWWFIKCGDSNLNGRYLNGSFSPDKDGLRWKKWQGTEYSLKYTQMKIRPGGGVW